MSIVNLELLRAESHDWPGELAHYATIMSYAVLQNYSLLGLSFYSYNFHLMMLIAFFLAQRIWFFLWRAAQFSDAHGPRFAVHSVLFFVLLDSLYCAVQLHLKESFAGSLYLVAPLGGSLLFYHVHLKTRVYSNVFTTELFSMLSRVLYHSFENWYCIGVLPLKFLPYEYMYIDTSRCMMLTGFVAVHGFLMLFCLELHCLGPEVLQQTRMLGEWRLISDPATLKPQDPKPAEWSYQNCPYQRGQVVQCKGRFYEAMATFNTSSPTCPSQCISLMTFILADSERTKVLVLASICCLAIALLPFIIWHNQWPMYAAMLVPIGAHFIFVKCPRYHAFFNPAPLNLAHLQFELSSEMSQYKINGSGIAPANGAWGAYADGLMDENSEDAQLEDEAASSNGSLDNLNEMLPDVGFPNQLQCPLFMSAVSASTLFFFGNSGAPRHDAPNM
jgi:hypothetical protein